MVVTRSIWALLDPLTSNAIWATALRGKPKEVSESDREPQV
jgi:hypothetical protein